MRSIQLLLLVTLVMLMMMATTTLAETITISLEDGDGNVNVELSESLRVPLIVLAQLMVIVKMNTKMMIGLLMTAAMARMMMSMAVDSP